MNIQSLGFWRAVLKGLAAAMVFHAANVSADVTQTPLFLSTAATPLMMLTMSRDEQLFNKAYPDYTDLDGNGSLDTTYQDSFDYSGYFDSALCYTYSSTNSRFKASVAAADGNGNGKAHECGTGSGNATLWSGNFLNWISMSRIDVLRYVLFGGYRSTDTSTRTVLERANIPNDLHAWAKVYSQSDVNYFVPFTGTQSFCNASFDSGSNTSTADSRPVIRRADNNYSEWAATALQQCRWYAAASNADTPSQPSSNSEFVARVEVCDPTSGAVRESFCKAYGTSSYKPAGLLQQYGEPSANGEPRMRFGLMTGSFSNPRSGGVLRRNIGKLAGASTTGCGYGDEINLATGQFCNSVASGAEGIINAINRLQINRLATWNGNWSDCGTYSINNRTGGNGHLNNPGTSSSSYNCSAWGNPIAEMYSETLRYLTGSTRTSSFNTGTDLVNMPSATWRNPYGASVAATASHAGGGGNPYCANCNVLVLSSALPSFDGDEVQPVSAIGLDTSVAINTATKNVGDLEAEEAGVRTGMSGQYLVGRSLNHLSAGQTGATLGVGESANTHEDLCQSRTVDDLSKVRGLCPDIPAQEGSMLVAGLAYKARTQDLQPSLTKPNTRKITANTYTVELAENLPKFEIPVGTGKISLAPLCQANNNGNATAASTDWRSCFLGSVGIGGKTSTVSPYFVYGRSLASDNSSGSFSLVWEDSQWGNDHDNDVVTMITYCVGSSCNYKVGGTGSSRNGTSNNYSASYSGYDICWRSDSTDVCGSNGTPSIAANEVLVRVENLSAYAGNAMLTGFTVTGSNADGVYRNSLRPGGRDGSVLTSTSNPSSYWDRPKVIKLTLGTSSAKQLQSPLWYAAKYGGFVTLNATEASTPLAQGSASWNKNNTGIPDAYFKVTDPSKLKASLNAVFSDVESRAASAAAVATNSTRLDTDTVVYQARFNASTWTGELLAYRLNDNGTVGSQLWATTDNVPAEGSRQLFTYNPTIAGTAKGVALEWANLSASQKAALQLSSETSDTNAQLRLAWLRGNRANETPSGIGLRARANLFGDIVNSDPAFSGAQDFRYNLMPTGTPGRDSYKAYVTAKKARTPVVFVGANDGFMHAINAATGAEMFAYMPSSALTHALALTATNYGTAANPHQYYVDGPSFIGDAYINGAWRTILIGSTGGGSKSIFALDVSNPAGFSTSDILFEINVSDLPELGNVLGQPIVTRTANGKWSAVFGNGYDSAPGHAYLIVVDLEDPSSIVKLQADSAGANGLSAPAVYTPDGTTTLAFAGDLQGGMWKFDLSSASTSAWRVAYGTTAAPLPLFRARGPSGEVQPITAAPTVGINPDQGNALMVYFGTGQYFASNDNVVGSTPPVQSMYGILDGAAITVTNRNVLSQKVVSVNEDEEDNTVTRTVTESSINWAANSGWYLDLKDLGEASGGGERVISKPILIADRVLFTTLIPSQVSCSFGGSSWLMDVSGVSNLSPKILDSSMRLELAVLKLSAVIKGGDSLYLPMSNIAGDISTQKGKNPGGDKGRLSWRQLQ